MLELLTLSCAPSSCPTGWYSWHCFSNKLFHPSASSLPVPLPFLFLFLLPSITLHLSLSPSSYLHWDAKANYFSANVSIKRPVLVIFNSIQNTSSSEIYYLADLTMPSMFKIYLEIFMMDFKVLFRISFTFQWQFLPRLFYLPIHLAQCLLYFRN